MSAQTGLTACIMGASGVSGAPVLNETLSYPSKDTFKRIIGFTNRPLTKETTLIPKDDYDRVDLHTVDLTVDFDTVVAQLKKVPHIEDVNLVYYCAYAAHKETHEEVDRINLQMMRNAVMAFELLCPDFTFFSLQTGGKHYGLEWYPQIKLNIPLKESDPRVPPPFGTKIFYYNQVDALHELCNGKKWKWAELRPDAIVGFVPQGNWMSIAQCLAAYFSFYKWNEGKSGTPPPIIYPGSWDAYFAQRTDTSSVGLARFHIYASLHPDKVHGEGFNVADNPRPTQWMTLWPILCNYFGLTTKGAADDEKAISISEYMLSHKDKWPQFYKETGISAKICDISDFSFSDYLTKGWRFSHPFCLDKMYATGYRENLDTPTQWCHVFDLMRRANKIPK